MTKDETLAYYGEIEGDLFAIGLPAIGHGCNTAGVMGAGIAVEFKRRWPGMFGQYQRRCERGAFQLGDYFMWIDPGGQVIFNLATQPFPSPSAVLQAIQDSVGSAMEACARMNIGALGIPRIGAGLGGLDWDTVHPALIRTAFKRGDLGVKLIVASLPDPVPPARTLSVSSEPTQHCTLCGRTVIVTPDGRGFPPDIAKRRLVRQCKAHGCPCEPQYTAGISL